MSARDPFALGGRQDGDDAILTSPYFASGATSRHTSPPKNSMMPLLSHSSPH